MKNLTEFSGVILRQAAVVRSATLAELKAASKVAPSAAPAAADSPGDAEAPAQASAEAPAEASADAPAEASADAPAVDAKAEAARVEDEALAAAVGEKMNIEGDRLKYLMGALKAVGRKGIDQVRKVRVFQGETGPAGAFSIDDLHFVVDRIVVASKSKDDRDSRGRGGKGGKGRGRSEGRGGGGSGGASGSGRPAGQRGGGGFDMMSKDERPGDVSVGGLGWSLSRVPGSEKKEGRGRGKPGRKGPRRGKPGSKPGEDRKPSNRNRNRKPRPDAGGKAPEVTVKAPMVAPGKKPAAAVPAKSVDVKPAESPKSEE